MKIDYIKIFCAEKFFNGESEEVIWKSLKANQSVSGEFQLVDNKNRPVWILGTYTPILSKDGSVSRCILIAKDITDSKVEAQARI